MVVEPGQESNDVRQDSLLRKPWVRLVIALGVLFAVILLIVYLRLALRWYLSPTSAFSVTDRKDLVQGLASVVQAVAVFVAGVVGLGGLYFTWRNLNQTRHLTEQGQITERFTRAIDQLGATDDDGDPRREIRLGGIYALERIDKESPRRAYHGTVMEVLTAYVRANAPWSPKSSESSDRAFIKPPGEGSVSDSASDDAAEQDKETGQGAEPPERTPPTDVQAILDVLRRREEYRVPEEHRLQSLDLRGTDLRGADLWKSHLEQAVLSNAHLEGANLYGAHLQQANFFSGADGAHLERANLIEAHLEGASLYRAHLEQAELRGTHLEEADLSSAHLEGANLSNAHLERANLNVAHLEGADLSNAHLEGAILILADLKGAMGLIPEQIKWTVGDKTLELPEYLIDHRPPLWSKSFDEQNKIIGNRLGQAPHFQPRETFIMMPDSM